MLDSTNSDPDCRRVLGVGLRVRPGTRHFPYNEIPTRALNTALLKCHLPSTDAIDMREKNQAFI